MGPDGRVVKVAGAVPLRRATEAGKGRRKAEFNGHWRTEDQKNVQNNVEQDWGILIRRVLTGIRRDGMEVVVWK
jgi:hypothetical protein